MCQVMLVDDEAYFREYLRTTIPWKDYGFYICGEAANGEEALQKIPEYKPDIIIADINMPILDGISFSYKVKEKYPYTGIIFVTGYNDFEYARQAIKAGVASYILKPFEKHELIESITKLRESINSLKGKEELIDNLQKKYKASLPVMKNNLLNNGIMDIYKGRYDKFEDELLKLNVRFPEAPFTAAIIKAGYEKEDENKHNIFSEIEDTINGISDEGFLVFEDSKKRFVYISSVKKHGYSSFTEICKKIIYCLSAKGCKEVSVGIGTAAQGISELPTVYDRASIAIKNKFLLGENKVIEYSSLKFGDSGKELYPFKLKNDLLMYMRLLDKEKAMNILNSIYRFLKSKNLSVDYVCIIYSELLSLCFSYLSEYGYKSEEAFGDNFYPFDELIGKQTISEVHDYVVYIYTTLIDYIKCNRNLHTSKAAEKVKEYIQNNFYKNNLLIEEIAASVYFHPSYLRYLFKRETGITIGEYLTQVRMTKAKELLKSKGMKFTDVAQSVGYSDAAYFSKCFKKYYSISPSDYEKFMKE